MVSYLLACSDEEPHRGVGGSEGEQSVGGLLGPAPAAVKASKGHEPGDGAFRHPSVAAQTL